MELGWRMLRLRPFVGKSAERKRPTRLAINVLAMFWAMGLAVASLSPAQSPLSPAAPEVLRDLLRQAFGRQTASSVPALDRLILGLAAADRSGAEKAVEALKRFKPWSRLTTAQPELVAAALRPIEPDLGRALARAEGLILAVQRLIARSGGISLDFLGALPAEEAQAWLQEAVSLPVGLTLKVLAAQPLRHRVVRLEPASLRVPGSAWSGRGFREGYGRRPGGRRPDKLDGRRPGGILRPASGVGRRSLPARTT